MKRVLSIILFLVPILTVAQTREYGRVAEIVSLGTYTDNNFNTSYTVTIKNKTNKVITSVQVSYAFRNLYRKFDITEIEEIIQIHQINIPSGSSTNTEYFALKPNHSNYSLYGIYIEAVRFSDGTVVVRSANQGGPNSSFGDYWP